MKHTALLPAAASLHAASFTAERKSLTLDGTERAIGAAIAQAHRNHTGGVIAVCVSNMRIYFVSLE